ncbi:MAG TPA: dihydrofolate reductase family protein [Candidatus Saccharimonadales bacterium]|nr:dihydrofolate reductase family protein [Candidatus Saccharimonadales bacterium]
MRKIIVQEFITIDGVMQAPGGPEEDPSAKFEFGGWQAPFMDDDAAAAITGPALKSDVEFLLGGYTFEIWSNYWPKHGDVWPFINKNMKYVLSGTQTDTNWQNTTFLRNLEDIKRLKESDGPDLHVWGSSKVVQLLLANNLVDELCLMTYPIILGQGKKLFAEGAAPRTFTLTESHVGKTGVIAARYVRAGEVKTGTVGDL